MIDFYALHRRAFCQFLFRCFYYNCSNESTVKETWKTHFCALVQHLRKLTFKVDYSLSEGWKSNMISHTTYPPSQSFVKCLFKCFPYFFYYFKTVGLRIQKMNTPDVQLKVHSFSKLFEQTLFKDPWRNERNTFYFFWNYEVRGTPNTQFFTYFFTK